MPEVHVFMAAGKTDEQKKNMMSDITHALVENLDCAPDSVTVQIVEAQWSHKMKGGRTFEERRTGKPPYEHGQVLRGGRPDLTRQGPGTQADRS
ncbi:MULTISPECIES: tautomerase family protein [Streptomyces]|uniref:tautomerase family protein n=1 Tax=Streptomyces TaxID=1883 RepID=UPI000A391E1A|nr:MULTISPECIES: tautomerase family protein [Streptomyces]MDX3583125.1 tautomerase family protein [Streptomyces europaeiscabiei]MDX3613838.1 tautomerase family protein [Streptomyces europaeiscabiei]MDX3633977.1 tautomerase family protein [Streptomyces europaeiscabiei]MDX3651440.1 tautomerase family protein [Streptomyces europaeiscabiei]WUD35349.1 tautomerase family protein [Streptomyces europaeiscabiei]